MPAGSKGTIGIILLVVACLSLFLDHAAKLVDPNIALFGMSIYDSMRAAGRLAFPLFVFFIAELCFKSKNLKKTIAILFVFALITELCGRLFYNDWSIFEKTSGSASADFIILNLTTSSMFTFLYGALGIFFYDRLKNKAGHPAVKYIPAVIFAVIGQVAGCSFFGLGVLLVFVLYVIRSKYRTWMIWHPGTDPICTKCWHSPSCWFPYTYSAECGCFPSPSSECCSPSHTTAF